MRALFHRNNIGEIPLVEDYAVPKRESLKYKDLVMSLIYEYITSIEKVDESNVELMGCSLLYLAQSKPLKLSWIKRILEKIGADQDILNRVLSARNLDDLGVL